MAASTSFLGVCRRFNLSHVAQTWHVVDRISFSLSTSQLKGPSRLDPWQYPDPELQLREPQLVHRVSGPTSDASGWGLHPPCSPWQTTGQKTVFLPRSKVTPVCFGAFFEGRMWNTK
ncbi:hypothetical protein MC885_004355 [Smutsia gigantea]|nr:hypothetical protein MC885_004355 [Smutsia gigantea]